MTLNNTWGYKTDDTDFKSATTLIRNLIDIASKGGNYLLNVGPIAEGVIPQPEVERLQAMGDWLKTNGQAIYGTTPSPFRRLPFDGRCTRKGDVLYLHVFNWPKDGIRVVGLKSDVKSAAFLSGGEAATIKHPDGANGEELVIAPPSQPDPVATVVKLTFAGSPQIEDQSATIRPAADGSVTLKASDADVHGDTAHYESGGGKDNIGFWTDAHDYVTWNVKAQPGRYTVSVDYACEDGFAGSEYTIQIGKKKLSGKINPTGGWANFRTESLGTIDIDPDASSVTVRPVAMPHGAVMNLRQLRLVPQK
jgi:alpha-L-fucosidase